MSVLFSARKAIVQSSDSSQGVTLAALQAGKNALVDGSLRDWKWYSSYFDSLRSEYPTLKIALLHIVAPKEAILARAKVSIFLLIFVLFCKHV
jgi:hypothetical protein